MEFLNLKNALEASKLSEETQEFVIGLFTLANHWKGEQGVQKIKEMMGDLMLKGASTQEAAVECYRYVRSQIF